MMRFTTFISLLIVFSACSKKPPDDYRFLNGLNKEPAAYIQTKVDLDIGQPSLIGEFLGAGNMNRMLYIKEIDGRRVITQSLDSSALLPIPSGKRMIKIYYNIGRNGVNDHFSFVAKPSQSYRFISRKTDTSINLYLVNSANQAIVEREYKRGYNGNMSPVLDIEF